MLLLSLSALLACQSEKESAALDSTDDTGTLPTGIDPRIVQGGAQVCDAPLAAPAWREVGEAWGMQDPGLVYVTHEEGPALGVDDFNGDGRLDMVVFHLFGKKFLHYADPSAEGFLWEELTGHLPSMGVGLADAGLDGDTDVFVGGQAPYVLINKETAFSMSGLLPLESTQNGSLDFVQELSPGDLDGDGLYELYMPLTFNEDRTEVGYNDAMYTINGAGVQIVEGAIPEATGLRHGFDAVWFDEDADGDQDLYLVNDFGSLYGPSTLLRNEGGTLVDAGAECLCTVLMNSKGVDVDDWNRDGLPDLYVAGNPRNALLQRLPDGTYVDVTILRNAGGVTEPLTGWGGLFVDHDNDGLRDLLSVQGDRWNPGNTFPHIDAPVQLLRQQEDGMFADVAPQIGLTGESSQRGAVAIDLNDDGLEDFIIPAVERPPWIYVSEGCTSNAWLEVDAPIGSRVEVEAGGFTQTQWAKVDSSFAAQKRPRMHFGLGEAPVVDRLTIVLPGGERVEGFGVEGRQRVRVE